VARRLSSRFGALRPVDGDTLLICCADGDNHVLGALAFAVLAATDGDRGLPRGQHAAARGRTTRDHVGGQGARVVCTMPEPAGVALDYVTRSAPGLRGCSRPCHRGVGEVREECRSGPLARRGREASQTLQSCRRTG